MKFINFIFETLVINGVIWVCALCIGLVAYMPESAVPVLLLSILIVALNRINKTPIKIKYFEEAPAFRLQKIGVGDWIDLRAAETIELKAGQYYNIRLGVGMELPKGYEALVLPRSSTPDKFGIILSNSMGVIDNSYSGDADEWRFPALAIRDTTIYKGDRIAQFRILENQPTLRFDIVKHLNKVSRGGFGSTGKR